METTQVTLKVKKNQLQSMEIDNGTIQGANAIVKALASVSDASGSDSAKVADVVNELIQFERLVVKTAKKVDKLDKKIQKDVKKRNKTLKKLESVQNKVESLKQGIISKSNKREELCDMVRNNGYYSRGIK